MELTSYRFALGRFDCAAVADGSKDYPIKNFFANAPLEEVEAELRRIGHPVDLITTPYTYLYVDTGEHRALADMGAGSLMPRTGKMVAHMHAAGIDPLDIDTVFITHAHPDHIGGTLDDEGRPIYGNARYYIWKGEWDFWTSEVAFEKAPAHFVRLARDKLEPVRDRLVLVEHGGEVVPGIEVIPAPGHTPGHVMVSVASGDERLFYIADTVLHPLHAEQPNWTPVYDILPDEAAASKQRIFERAAQERVLVMGQHFHPFPSLGYVTKHGEGWHWEPIEAA